MNTRWLAIGLGAVLPCLAAAAAEIPAEKVYDFEQDFPGAMPKGWRDVWSKPESFDVRCVSNLYAVGGDNSLQLTRLAPPGGKPLAWRLSPQMPKFESGWLAFSMCFRLEGSGEGGMLYEFDFLSAGGRDGWVRVQLGSDRFRFVRMGIKRFWVANRDLLTYEKDRWYRLNLWFPTPKVPEKELFMRLDEQLPDGKFKDGPVRKLPIGGFEQPVERLTLLVGTLTHNTLYLDDVSFRNPKTPPPEP